MALDLDELERLAGEITGGQWEVVDTFHVVARNSDPDAPRGYSPDTDGLPACEADARLLVAAKHAVPELVREVRRLREALATIADETSTVVMAGWCECHDCRTSASGHGYSPSCIAEFAEAALASDTGSGDTGGGE